MKHYLYILLFICIFFSSCTKDEYVYTSFHEPAIDGLRFLHSNNGWQWDSIPGIWLEPQVGKQKVMRDPSIQRTPDGIFHLVWTSSWKGDLGFGYASSTDLKHWSKERLITVMNDTTTINVWAPELFWDDIRREMMIVWSSCIPGKFNRGIEEDDNNHRLYYTTTKDFLTFSPAQLLYDPGFSCIDATIVKHGEHDYVMVFKDNTRNERNIKVAFATDPHGPWTHVSPPITESYTEGPATAKVKDGWLIYYDRYRTKNFGAQFTTDFHTFKDVSNKILIPALHKHGTIFKVSHKIIKSFR